MENIGKVAQVIGPVIDVKFDEGHLPDLLTAIKIEKKDGEELSWKSRKESAPILFDASRWEARTALCAA